MESGTWHREEMPTAEELAEAGARLYRNGGADIIITHQPSDRMRIFLGGDRSEESPLGAFLDQVEQEGRFGSWYFGRLHRDKRDPAPAYGGVPGDRTGPAGLEGKRKADCPGRAVRFFSTGGSAQKNSAARRPRRFFSYVLSQVRSHIYQALQGERRGRTKW